ncbi:MAG: response regulator [Gemmatimonadaceae bacterium]
MFTNTGGVVVDRARGVTILLVDDDERDRRLFRRVLERAGYGVAESENGLEGICAALVQHPAAVVLDVSMPGLTGWEVAKALRADARTSPIPIVVLSAHREPPGRTDERQGLHDAYVEKPQALPRLLEVLEELTSRD